MSGSGDTPMFSFTRFKLRLQLTDILDFRGDKASYRSVQVRDAIQHWLDRGGEVDQHLALMPWRASEETLLPRLPKAPVSTPLPTHKDYAAPYFHSINYYTRTSEMYFYVRLRHTCPKEVLMNVSTVPQLTVWIASLQLSEKPTKGGFFVYSNRAFASSNSLVIALQDYVKYTAKKSIEIALYWAPVNMNNFNLVGCVALQIDVDETDYFLLKRILTQLYNRTKVYPAGLPMVYVPPVNRCVDRDLLKSACDSQIKYLEAITVYEFRCFRHTDLSASIPVIREGTEGVPSTLWEVFHSVMVDSVRIFHSTLECIDRRGAYIQVVVMPIRARELAKTIFNSPVAFFRQYFTQETLEKLFDESSIIQGYSETYDPVTRKVTNTDELLAKESISQFWHVDIQAVLDNLNRVQRQVHPPQRETTSVDSSPQGSSFSFNPGSVTTTSALKKARFEATMVSPQVPGTPMEGVSGEGP
jgi:hypothetical protein